jgi:hypothetical protein
VLLLITGASGVGKTSARIAIEGKLGAAVECVELHHVLPPSSPAQMNRVWRQHAAEVAVGRAIELQAEGRHLLLAGDPVPAIEIVAAPSSPGLNAVAVCLFHADPDAQAARLAERGDHAGLALLPDHEAFADWMRCQATDPLYMSHVASADGWDAMRWDRLPRVAACWAMEVIDTSHLSRSEVASRALAWCHEALKGTAPLLHVPSD